METTSYCDMLERQLTVWRSKIREVIHLADRLTAGEREAVRPSTRSLHAIVGEIDSQLTLLKTACPADWLPQRHAVDDKMRELQETLKKLSDRVGGPLIPDSLSWVSS
ncbi:MAG: hypothetical protein E4H48_03345 [Syntrophobacterales bacterium]|nr:MAG: hypothetical protein E4H48_03345 [Syntrophobacterales bacterium]